jgi:hypothetical protein
MTMVAKNLEKQQDEVGKAKNRFALKEDVCVVRCYEAGRHGFWLHRYLVNCKRKKVVMDSSSIEVPTVPQLQRLRYAGKMSHGYPPIHVIQKS